MMFRFKHLIWLILFHISFTSALWAGGEIDAEVTRESGLFYKPNNVEPGTYVFGIDDAVIEQPALWGLSAKLEKDLKLVTSKGEITISASAVLPAITVAGVPGVPNDKVIFCTERRGGLKSSVNLGFGVQRSIWDSARDGQICVLDTDNNGSTDYGFLINSGSESDRLPQKVNSVVLDVKELRLAGEGYKVKILLWLIKPPVFHLDIYHKNEKLDFKSVSALGMMYKRNFEIAKDYRLPYNVDFFGARFKIIAVDKVKREVTVEFIEENTDLLVPLPAETVTTVR